MHLKTFAIISQCHQVCSSNITDCKFVHSFTVSLNEDPNRFHALPQMCPSPRGFFFFGCIGSSLLRADFSLVAVSGGSYSLRCVSFSLWWLLLFRSMGSRHAGFSSCSTRASVVAAHGLSSCSTRVLELASFSSCGAWAQ